MIALVKESDMTNRTCTFDGCDRRYEGRGLCSSHAWQRRHHGYCWPIPTREWPARFWIKVDKTDGCWFWTAATQRHGYGIVSTPGGSTSLAHRVAYELAVGPIPNDLPLDHLCRVRNCVNPDHLEPVTTRENVLRSDSVMAHRAQMTHCGRGHLFDEENTRIVATKYGTLTRNCRECARITRRRRRALDQYDDLART